MKPLSTGIIGVVGSPGSGKSLCTIREMTRIAVYEHRPIYTNVPIKPKRLRAYIYRRAKHYKSHAIQRRLAQLIKPTNQEHFLRFCKRLKAVDEATAAAVNKRGGDPDDLSGLSQVEHMACVAEAMQVVEANFGKPKMVGAEADWYPAGSCFFLDELHKWFPSGKPSDQTPEVLAFTSMHRHLQMKLYVLSQRWMNVSLAFRAMAAEVVTCMNYSKVPIVGSIRLHGLVNVFRFRTFNGEDIEERTGQPRIGAKVIRSELYCPEWTGAPEYDCYHSISHGGSMEQQQADLQKVTGSMLGGETRKLIEERDKAMKEKRSNIGSIVQTWFFRICYCSVIFWVGRLSAPPEVVTELQVERVEVPTPMVAPAAVGPAYAMGPRRAPEKLTAVLDGKVLVDGSTLHLGGLHRGWTLEAIEDVRAESVWTDPQGVPHIWRPGGGLERLRELPPELRTKLAGSGNGYASGPSARPSAAATDLLAPEFWLRN